MDGFSDSGLEQEICTHMLLESLNLFRDILVVSITLFKSDANRIIKTK